MELLLWLCYHDYYYCTFAPNVLQPRSKRVRKSAPCCIAWWINEWRTIMKKWKDMTLLYKKYTSLLLLSKEPEVDCKFERDRKTGDADTECYIDPYLLSRLASYSGPYLVLLLFLSRGGLLSPSGHSIAVLRDWPCDWLCNSVGTFIDGFLMPTHSGC